MNNIKKKQICENHSAKGTDTMAVTVQEKERLFTIHTQNTTYQMKAEDMRRTFMTPEKTAHIRWMCFRKNIPCPVRET